MVNAGRACYMGMGVRMPKYLTIYYRSTGPLHENMRICGEFSGKNCPTSIAINQLAVKITRRSLSFGCICINSSTCTFLLSINGGVKDNSNILQMIQIGLSWIRWSLFQRVQLAISPNSLASKKATSHSLDQWWQPCSRQCIHRIPPIKLSRLVC